MFKQLIEPVLALRRKKSDDRESRGQPAVRAIPALKVPPPPMAGVGRPSVDADTAIGAADTEPRQATNPYLEARREWNERYGTYIQQAHHWRTLAFISGAIALVAVIGIAYIGAQSKVVPYVVEVDKLGQVAAVAPAERTSAVDPRVIKAYLARFVVDWRSVTVDRQAQKASIDRVYAMLPSASIAVRKLNEYYEAHNPFAAAASASIDVSITNVLQISAQTWQVEWLEVTRDSRGEVKGRARLRASFILGITPPTKENLILVNPLGIYLVDLNWSQQLS
jgi:type IV secretory pathway TrbF-like protein